MKTLPQYLMPMPDRYRDGSFDVVVRDAGSAVIFWDLVHEATATGTTDQLAVRSRSTEGDFDKTLNLHDHAGHLLLPLQSDAREYIIELGWLSKKDGEFTVISSDTISLPATPTHHRRNVDPATSGNQSPAVRHPRYAGIAVPIEKRGFRPGLSA